MTEFSQHRKDWYNHSVRHYFSSFIAMLPAPFIIDDLSREMLSAGPLYTNMNVFSF